MKTTTIVPVQRNRGIDALLQTAPGEHSLSAPGSPRPSDGRGVRGEGNGEWREGRVRWFRFCNPQSAIRNPQSEIECG